MTTADRRRAAAERIRDAESACGELADALKGAGVRLPSLGLDVPSCVGPDPLALVELGRRHVQTARALVAALRANEATGAER
ncbi:MULTISPECIES: hypothetical protein [unclassified Streptomyces]|uniref:hypothetical protein n=1 Tax=unclassified Streptomyces TaxID=2593676 RepID=UPI0022B62558|nr:MULTISPECIES: hypothetical protein [unclassified Streptomyces]MCZ7415071.1 hypothetical protein [Streptomyces sp. WMMC897]MCZ7432014.1 hypothetical protein [Streptomyces sp. WMMC1477]